MCCYQIKFKLVLRIRHKSVASFPVYPLIETNVLSETNQSSYRNPLQFFTFNLAFHIILCPHGHSLQLQIEALSLLVTLIFGTVVLSQCTKEAVQIALQRVKKCNTCPLLSYFAVFFIPLVTFDIPNISDNNTHSLFLFINFKPSNVLGNGG